MKINMDDFMGKTMNRLTVIGFEKPPKGRLRLKCRCECGNITYVFPYSFSSGDIKSCGCARFGHSECHKGNTSRRTHNLRSHRFYKKWNDMVRRCHNPNEPAYRFYGALGIEVCEEWRYTPSDFIEWCEATYPKEGKFSIDRIDGSKGYSPDNCRWVTQLEQVHNLKNNRFITVNGETHCVTEWSRLYGISPGSIYSRVHKGQSFEEAITYLLERKRKTTIQV